MYSIKQSETLQVHPFSVFSKHYPLVVYPDNIVPACPIGNIEKYEVIVSYLQARANYL